VRKRFKNGETCCWSFRCAHTYGGGWWFYTCHKVLLTGPYVEEGDEMERQDKGLVFMSITGRNSSLASAEMKIRPKWFKSAF